MNMISAKVVADSKNEFGNRITSMVVTLPRIILAELNTHRMFSRNSASSRAIPFEKMVDAVHRKGFIPIAWQKDHKGMQGTEYMDAMASNIAQSNWLAAKMEAIRLAKRLSDQGVTKQICNRLLEPFMWHTVIITATEWENFFALRCPKYDIEENQHKEFRSKIDCINYYSHDGAEFENSLPKTDFEWLKCNKGQAEIHMMALAESIWDAYNESTPKELEKNEWHIPFIGNIDSNEELVALSKKYNSTINEVCLKISTARCARVSYTVVGEEDKEPNYENDINLHDRLAQSGHWSPFEHCAKNPISGDELIGKEGNLRGFIQYRKTFNNENITKQR